MDRQEFLREAQALPVLERIALAKDLLNSVQKELSTQESDQSTSNEDDELDRQLAAAAEKAIPDYLPGGALFLPDILDDFYDYEEK